MLGLELRWPTPEAGGDRPVPGRPAFAQTAGRRRRFPGPRVCSSAAGRGRRTRGRTGRGSAPPARCCRPRTTVTFTRYSGRPSRASHRPSAAADLVRDDDVGVQVGVAGAGVAVGERRGDQARRSSTWATPLVPMRVYAALVSSHAIASATARSCAASTARAGRGRRPPTAWRPTSPGRRSGRTRRPRRCGLRSCARDPPGQLVRQRGPVVLVGEHLPRQRRCGSGPRPPAAIRVRRAAAGGVVFAVGFGEAAPELGRPRCRSGTGCPAGPRPRRRGRGLRRDALRDLSVSTRSWIAFGVRVDARARTAIFICSSVTTSPAVPVPELPTGRARPTGPGTSPLRRVVVVHRRRAPRSVESITATCRVRYVYPSPAVSLCTPRSLLRIVPAVTCSLPLMHQV